MRKVKIPEGRLTPNPLQGLSEEEIEKRQTEALRNLGKHAPSKRANIGSLFPTQKETYTLPKAY